MTEVPIFAAGFIGIEHFTPPWDIFFLPLLNGLVALYKLLFSDFLIAIVVFTIVIRTLLIPIFNKQLRSQKEMQRMQPLVREVQRKYKGDRQKISQETMALYREHGVNPAAGCLPLLLQLPILLALYNALTRASGVVNFTPNPNDASGVAFESLRTQLDITPAARANDWNIPISGPCNAPELSQLSQFLPLNCQLVDPVKLSGPIDVVVEWLATPWAPNGLNLAVPDNVFAIPVFGFALSGLAVLAGLLTFVQAKMAQPMSASGPDQPPDPTTQATATMTYLFPLMYVFWGGIFPSGLIVYWIVYSAYVIVQQYMMMGWGNLFPILGWTPRFARGSAAAGVVATSPGTDRPREARARDRGREDRRGRDERRGREESAREDEPSDTRRTKSPPRAAAQQGRSGGNRRRRGRRAR